ncbi:hypothetical protein RFI_01904 [Reticulomyxa filosa]|uniref:Uncharacterized protein n=1 Tax=Reticulomyxa filosa TaxID=46433 RepID=X6PAS5_RETFI|nr:hypothetical protein RFI_01904 [Reticulomyxa filosa]|eukprot:ETO35169.1 hypothetical protein RFI_01904 [Reticulomyxa filosa]
MPYKAFVSIEKEMHEVTLVSLRLKRLKEKVIDLINTTNSKTRYSIPHFKIVDSNGQYITSNRELRITFKTKPVFFFIHFIYSLSLFLLNNDDEKYPENEKKQDEFYNVVTHRSAEIDKDFSWNKANKKAHEMVNEMINNK